MTICACGRPVEEHLTHYIVVRRDLPLGVLAAQVTHAAGESFYKLACVAQGEHPVFNREVAGASPAAGSTSFPGSSVQSASPQGVEVAGSIPARGATFDPSETYAIVLGARNESRLLKLERALREAGVPHVAVREPDSPYNGQLMAVGLVPAPAHELRRHVADFHMLRECADARAA